MGQLSVGVRLHSPAEKRRWREGSGLWEQGVRGAWGHLTGRRARDPARGDVLLIRNTQPGRPHTRLFLRSWSASPTLCFHHGPLGLLSKLLSGRVACPRRLG